MKEGGRARGRSGREERALRKSRRRGGGGVQLIRVDGIQSPAAAAHLEEREGWIGELFKVEELNLPWRSSVVYSLSLSLSPSFTTPLRGVGRTSDVTRARAGGT